MNLFKSVALVLAAVALFASCSISGPEGTLGTYTVVCDKTVSANSGSGIIFNTMYNEVVKASKGFDFRTAANDKVVISVGDKIAADYKDQASEAVTISIVFREANAMGEAEKKTVVVKSYNFTPVN